MHVSKMPLDWTLAEMFSFNLAKAVLETRDLRTLEICAPYYLLHFHQSDIREHCLKSIWLFRKCAPKELILKSLFKNIASSLGSVSSSAAIAREFFDSDEDLFEAANAFEPQEDYIDQYQERLKKLKEEGLLDQCQSYFLPFELKVRLKIEKTALLMEWPLSPAPAVQLQLPA